MDSLENWEAGEEDRLRRQDKNVNNDTKCVNTHTLPVHTQTRTHAHTSTHTHTQTQKEIWKHRAPQCSDPLNQFAQCLPAHSPMAVVETPHPGAPDWGSHPRRMRNRTSNDSAPRGIRSGFTPSAFHLWPQRPQAPSKNNKLFKKKSRRVPVLRSQQMLRDFFPFPPGNASTSCSSESVTQMLNGKNKCSVK